MKGTNRHGVTWADVEKRANWARERDGFREWEVNQRLEGQDQPDFSPYAVLGDGLASILRFIAEGHIGAPCGVRSLEKRAWIVLYAMRPDLIDGQTIESVSKFFECSPVSLNQMLRLFRRDLPEFDYRLNRSSLPGVRSAIATQANLKRWQKHRLALQASGPSAPLVKTPRRPAIAA